MLLQSELDLAYIKVRYNSYCAASVISIYNPISIMSAFKRSRIENFWVGTGSMLSCSIFFVLWPTEYFCYRQIPSLRQKYFGGLFPAPNDWGASNWSGGSVSASGWCHVQQVRSLLNPADTMIIFTLRWFRPTLCKAETLILLYYAGYLTMKVRYLPEFLQMINLCSDLCQDWWQM